MRRVPGELDLGGRERVVCVQTGVHRRGRGCMHRVRCREVQGNDRERGLYCMSGQLELERRQRDMHLQRGLTRAGRRPVHAEASAVVPVRAGQRAEQQRPGRERV